MFSVLIRRFANRADVRSRPAPIGLFGAMRRVRNARRLVWQRDASGRLSGSWKSE